MKISFDLTPDEADALLAWLDEQYTETIYPDIDSVSAQAPDMLSAFNKLSEALDNAD